jgi:hypothetical protein
MKTTITQIIYGLSFSSILTWTASAHGKNISELALDCHGVYQVISSSAAFTPAPNYPTRAPIVAHAGANEKIKIVSLKGSGCQALKPYYSVDLQMGMELDHYNSTYPATAEQSSIFAKHEMGKTYSFKVGQSFAYQLANGDLPFFPLINSEVVTVLGLYGKANSKLLYGTPTLSELDDVSKSKIAYQLFGMIDWGIKYQGTNYDTDQWLDLLVSLDFKDQELALKQISDLVLVFNNMTKLKTQFYTYSASNAVSKKVSSLLNKYGQSKWAKKIDILKMNPALLTEQGVNWSTSAEVLNLTSAEIEDFLQHALIKVQALNQVLEVHEAVVLKEQYQGAASALKATPLDQNKHFELSPLSENLITSILAL